MHPSVARLVAFWCFALVEPFRSTERRCESLSSRHPLPPTHQHGAQRQSRQQRHVPSQGLVPGGSGQQRASSAVVGIDVYLALCECSMQTRGVRGRQRPVWQLRAEEGGSAACAACAAWAGSGRDRHLAKPCCWGRWGRGRTPWEIRGF